MAEAGQASSPSNLGKSISCGRPTELFLVLYKMKRTPPFSSLFTLSGVNNLTSSAVSKYSETREAAKNAAQNMALHKDTS